MSVVPSTLQVVLGIVLVLLGVCGNLILPFVSYRTTVRCPHITVLAALDFTAALLGPGFMLVTIFIGPTWLEHNKLLCHSLSFLISSMFITGFLVLFILAVFCQKVQHNIYLHGIRRARRREFAFLAVCLLTGLLLGCLPLLGWSSYSGIPFLHPCPLGKHSISNYSLFYLVCSFAVLLLITALVFRARKRARLYPLRIIWERHEFETKINDPELTTTASSNTSSCHSRSRTRSTQSWEQSRVHSRNQSRSQSRNHSRRSSVHSRAGMLDSPTMPKKHFQQPRLLDYSLLDTILRNQVRSRTDTAETLPERSPSPVNSERKDSSSSSPSIQLSGGVSRASIPRDPFVISSRIPYNIQALLNVRKVFQSPRFLPKFTAPQQQRSLSRLLSLRCCVTLICWLPFFVTVVLQLSSINYPQVLHVFIQWLIFIPSSISSLFPLRDPSYRQALRRSVNAAFKACAGGNKTKADLSKSRDVELKIEGTEEVRLRDVTLNKV